MVFFSNPNHFPPAEEAPAELPFLRSPAKVWALLLLVFASVHFAALFSPSLLDDADAAHASAAAHVAETGHWVTLKVDGIRYLEKPPLPYWLVAVDYRIFGENVLAAHLPGSLSVLGLAVLAWAWARRAYGDRAAFYAALGLLTCSGVFLFTRIFIPEALLTLLLSLALYRFLTGMEDGKPSHCYLAWTALALATLAKGLIAPVFVLTALGLYLLAADEWRNWGKLRPATGFLLYLAIAAPWHILAGLRNPGQGHPHGNIPSPGNVHGFFYFYFINEHVLRFLGRRYPDDYNKLPAALYWLLHLIWLFPWSAFLPVVAAALWRSRGRWRQGLRAAQDRAEGFRSRTTWLLGIYAVFILAFFSLSTNQEYYTFPAYFPLIVLTAAALAGAEARAEEGIEWRSLLRSQAAFAAVGAAAAAALAYGLWSARSLPYVPDIGDVLARRDVAGYTLSMAHFFDLTGPSFAALRLPAGLACAGLLLGSLGALGLRLRRRHFEASVSVGFTGALLLIAAHIALVRFEPALSSRSMADTINRIAGPPGRNGPSGENAILILYGDQADGSSILFYTHRPALLVHGRMNAVLWGSYYSDAPHIFLSPAELLAAWGRGPRKFLFVPQEHRAAAAALLQGRGYLLQELSGKALYTDRPIDDARPAFQRR